jgi:hypothetical protein
MGWLQKILSNKQRPERQATDSLNYALHLLLNFSTVSDEEKITCLRAAFPTVLEVEGHALLQQARNLNREAIALFYDVRDGAMSAAQATARLRTAHPQIDEKNIQALCVSGQVAASR